MDNKKKKVETKRDKFVRLAEYRVNQVLDGIRKIGNLSDKPSTSITNYH
jgi:hypothetical protein